MPAYNFLKCYAADVESGKKRCTIRRKGKRKPPVKGDEIKLFTGQRTKFCRLLGKGICTAVTPVIITNINGQPEFFTGVANEWIEAPADEVEKLALADGFESAEKFFAFFLSDTSEFIGHLIEWEPQV